MSFILDALKKSEERRRLEEGDRTPRQRIFDLTWSGTQRRPIWIFLALAVLLVALACGWWLRGVSLGPALVDQPAGSIATVPSVQIPSSASSSPAIATENPSQSPSARKAGPAPFAPVPAAPVGEAVQPVTDRPRPVASKAPAKPPAPATQPAGRRQVSGTVPAALRERMSSLNMSVHFYAEDPAQRLVRIDDRFLREGQALSDGLVLVEVTPRGVIFSSAGELFEVPRLGEQR